MQARIFVAELIGTFALVFIGAGAGALGIGGLVGVALAHGLVIVSFAYAYGHISGTHINPAVTFGLVLAGVMSWTRALVYWIAQFLGGILAAALLAFLLGVKSGLGATVLAPNISPLQGLVIEGVLTFFLVNTVLHAAVAGKAGNFAGLAIGMTLTLSILMGGPLTGASLNPARTLGPAILTSNLSEFWVYLAGTFAGAAVAAGVYKFLGSDATGT